MLIYSANCAGKMKSQKKRSLSHLPNNKFAMSVRRLSPDIESQLLLIRIDVLCERLQRQHDQNRLLV